jgi:hypothetical protein
MSKRATVSAVVEYDEDNFDSLTDGRVEDMALNAAIHNPEILDVTVEDV